MMLDAEGYVIAIFKNMTDALTAKNIYEKAGAPFKFFTASMKGGKLALQFIEKR